MTCLRLYLQWFVFTHTWVSKINKFNNCWLFPYQIYWGWQDSNIDTTIIMFNDKTTYIGNRNIIVHYFHLFSYTLLNHQNDSLSIKVNTSGIYTQMDLLTLRAANSWSKRFSLWTNHCSRYLPPHADDGELEHFSTWELSAVYEPTDDWR